MPNDADIRAAMERILQTAPFANSKRLGAFLRFVVTETLAGRQDHLKAFTIACEVYGRDETFNPKTDAVVRVDAGRLRQRLTSYYQTEGGADTVRIALPKGRYIPRFSWNEVTAPETPDAEPVPTPSAVQLPQQRRKWPAPSVATGLLVAMLVGLSAAWYFFSANPTTLPQAPVDAVQAPAAASAPFLAVLPLTTTGDDPAEQDLAAGFVEAIITDLAKLSDLSVMAHASLLSLDSRAADLAALRRDFGATHALRGSLKHNGHAVRINLQLIDIKRNQTIWAEHLDGDPEQLLAMQYALSKGVAGKLSITVSGEENERLQRSQASNATALALYRQALILLMPPNEIDRIVTARHMFQRVIDLDPRFGGGYAGKGFSHSVTVLFMKTSTPQAELQTGIELAKMAIAVDPDFGMGYATLAFAYAIAGRLDDALEQASHAIAVQPGDAFTQFVYGMSLTLAKRPAEAITPLSEAIRLDPAEPRTPYRNLLGIARLAVGEYAAAADLFDQNLHNGGPTGPHMDVFRAYAYARLGREDEARALIRDLMANHPEFPVAAWLEKWHRSPADAAQSLETLQRLGLARN